MDTNEIMTTEEVVAKAAAECLECEAYNNSLASIKIAAVIGIAAICVLGYEFVAKPLIAKIKQKKIDEAVGKPDGRH